MIIRFATGSRSPKRNRKLRIGRPSAKILNCKDKSVRVPNGPSQQPGRKRAEREKNGLRLGLWRSTAQDRRVFYSRGFSRETFAGETVSTVGSWRRERPCHQNLSGAFSMTVRRETG